MACRQMDAKTGLVRIVRTPEGLVEIDRDGKMNGRGAYICVDKQCILNAQKARKLERSLGKAPCTDIYAQLLRQVELTESVVLPAGKEPDDDR